MDAAPPSLDLARLEKLRHHAGGKLTARCPACAEEERDRTGNHLAIFRSGKFTCVADPGHCRRVWELVGVPRHDRPASRPERSSAERERRKREQERQELEALARDRRADLVARYRWHPADLWEDSPTRPDDAADDPRGFLASLFPPADLVWTGSVHQSGPGFRDRWRTVEDWFHAPPDALGPMTTPATWKPGATSRSRAWIARAPFVVLDFDGQDGRRPETPADLARHLADSLALVRWLRERLRWRLAAILSTGGKSIHAWFENPDRECLDSLHPILTPFGIDGGLIGHAEHPCRLPGQVHQDTGRKSQVLWLR